MFQTRDVIKILNVKVHFIINLVEKGFVVPIKDAHGRGSGRLYSYKNLFEIYLFSHLPSTVGFSHRRIYEIIKEIMAENIDISKASSFKFGDDVVTATIDITAVNKNIKSRITIWNMDNKKRECQSN